MHIYMEQAWLQGVVTANKIAFKKRKNLMVSNLNSKK